MAEQEKDPEIQEWLKLLNERKSLLKMVQKEQRKTISFSRVKGQMSKTELEFFKDPPDYEALSEDAMLISSQAQLLLFKNRDNVVAFNDIFNLADSKVKKSVEEIIKTG